MLEANTFRMLMLLLGVMALGSFLLFFFNYPVVTFDVGSADYESYNQLMTSEDKSELTPYDVTLYYIKAIPRGNVNHY